MPGRSQSLMSGTCQRPQVIQESRLYRNTSSDREIKGLSRPRLDSNPAPRRATTVGSWHGSFPISWLHSASSSARQPIPPGNPRSPPATRRAPTKKTPATLERLRPVVLDHPPPPPLARLRLPWIGSLWPRFPTADTARDLRPPAFRRRNAGVASAECLGPPGSSPSVFHRRSIALAGVG